MINIKYKYIICSDIDTPISILFPPSIEDLKKSVLSNTAEKNKSKQTR